MSYTDGHKMFLQAILQRGIINTHDANEISTQLFQRDCVSEIMSCINNQLRPLNMSLNCIACEHTGENYWILSNNTYDEVGSFQTEFTKAQLALIRKVFSEIIASKENCLPSSDCLNMCLMLEIKLSKTDAEEFLNKMVTRKWLYCKDGWYYFGVRTIGELMPYFKKTYENTFDSCYFCRQVIFYGQRCPHCETVMHIHCLKKYESVRQSLQCPKCTSALSADGSNLESVNEDSIEMEDISQPGPSQRSKRRNAKND